LVLLTQNHVSNLRMSQESTRFSSVPTCQ
jgi:hypothetical protein